MAGPRMAGPAWDASSEHSSTSSNPPQPSIFTGSTAATGDFADRPSDSPSAESFDDALQFASIPRWPFAGSDTSSITSTPAHNSAVMSPPMPSPQPVELPGAQQWRNDLMLSPTIQSPDPNRPSSVSSYGSTLSFFGMNNDHHLSTGVSPLSPPARRSGGLGPPPSARRGPPSYYSHNSYVAPIKEESDSGSSWRGSHRRRSGLETVYSFDEDMEGPPYEMDGRRISHLPGGVPRHMDDALVDVASPPGSMIMQNPQAAQSQQRLAMPVSQHSRLRSPATTSDQPVGGQGASMIEMANIPPHEPAATYSGDELRNMLQAHVQSASSMSAGPNRELHLATSQQTLVNHGPPVNDTFPDESSRYSPDEVEKVLGGLQSAGLLDQATANQMRQPSLDTYIGFADVRRNPEVDVRDLADSSSEASDQDPQNIPSLIMRATSMAAQVERGAPVAQQSSSYTLLEDSLMYVSDKKRQTRHKDRAIRASSQLLAGNGGKGSRAHSHDEKDHMPTKNGKPWLNFSTSRIDFRLRPPRGTAQSSYDNQGNKRRYCGLPRWAFFLSLAIFLVCLIIAIVIPIAILGLPGASNKDSDPTIGNCVPISPCLNGGVSMLSSGGACTCVCTSGFTGSHCEVQSDDACTTAAIGTIQKATIGSQIAPLLNQAITSFNIPLNGKILLSLFSTANLTCSTENALVVFQSNGLSKRTNDRNVFSDSDLFFPGLQLAKRQAGRPNVATAITKTASSTSSSATPTTSTQVQEAAVGLASTPIADVSAASISTATTPIATGQSTSTSISTTPTPLSTSQVPTTANSTSSSLAPVSLSSSASPSIPTPTNSTTTSSATPAATSISPTNSSTPVTFAKIAVLYVLQDSRDLSTAVTAQQHLQSYFTAVQKAGSVNVTEARNVSLETGYSIDLIGFSLRIRNGTVLGGSGGAKS